MERKDLATAALIYNGLYPGMLIQYPKSKYIWKNQDIKKILVEVTSYIDEMDLQHIKRILMQGCPSYLVFKEDSANKLAVIQRGNQQTFLQHPEVIVKIMNKEEKIRKGSSLFDLGWFTFPHISAALPKACTRRMESIE
jgi:hypothetical protein